MADNFPSKAVANFIVPPTDSLDIYSHNELPQEHYLYEEPLNTPGLVPQHLKRATVAGLPLLEILQRLVYRLQPSHNIDKILAFVALYNAGIPVYRYFKDAFVYLCTSQITVPEYDPIAKEILSWMTIEVMNKSRTTEALMMSGGLNGGSLESEHYYRSMMLQRGRAVHASGEVQILPPIGRRIFWVGFRPFLFYRSGASRSRHSDNVGKLGYQQNSIVLHTLGWSLKPLQDFLKLCHDLKLENRHGTTTIYFSSGSSHPEGDFNGTWTPVNKSIRKLDTIDIDEIVKSDLIKDADYYYSAEARKFYADCGIPYRRGYLFYGPPGTGKTSFSAALAGHLNCDLYTINLASGDVSDGKLHRLFLTLPRKCVVVIEDIDSAGIGREQEVIPPKSTPQQLSVEGTPVMQSDIPFNYGGPPQEKRRAKITLSGLLNAIDGNASQEGRLLIMTSNNPDVLDEALTRPGRIDKQIYFGHLSPSAAISMFERLVGRAAIATGNFTHNQITTMAIEFSGKLPANVFTHAQVQSFLQSCRGDPHKAIQEVHTWAKTSLEASEGLKLHANGTKSKTKEKQTKFSASGGSAASRTTLSGEAQNDSNPEVTVSPEEVPNGIGSPPANLTAALLHKSPNGVENGSIEVNGTKDTGNATMDGL